MRRAPRDFRMYPKLETGLNTGIAAPSGFFGTTTSNGNGTFTAPGYVANGGQHAPTSSAQQPIPPSPTTDIGQITQDPQNTPDFQASPVTITR